MVALDDAPAAPGRAADAGRVYDQDLQVLVNRLWAAGARAIGVNGQRLTPTTAIRASRRGDHGRLPAARRTLRGHGARRRRAPAGRLRGSSADRRLAALRDRFGIRYGTRRSGALRLPAAGAFRPRYAVPRDGGGR
ncbi:DUF881 domain-containing protein [Actinomadura luteofluorescens]|uniref:DUF881 domain-containing protein n=1 Tax=Actinomadura luteofluorescens TaxID=46163 RepID=UPI00362BAFE0